jgi:rhodanese-related sulfurtransferase
MPIENISSQHLKQWLENNPELQVIDVRTKEEFDHLGHIPQASLIPLHELPYAYRMIDSDKEAVILCQHGVRSMDACYFLQSQGYEKLYNLSEGFSGWMVAVAMESASQ